LKSGCYFTPRQTKHTNFDFLSDADVGFDFDANVDIDTGFIRSCSNLVIL